MCFADQSGVLVLIRLPQDLGEFDHHHFLGQHQILKEKKFFSLGL